MSASEMAQLGRLHRANVRRTDDGYEVCWGDHQRSERCEWEPYEPQNDAERHMLTEKLAALSPTDPADAADRLGRRMGV